MTKYSVIDDLIFDSSLTREYSCAILTVLFKYVANIPKNSKTRIKTNRVSKIVLPFLFSKMNLPPGYLNEIPHWQENCQGKKENHSKDN